MGAQHSEMHYTTQLPFDLSQHSTFDVSYVICHITMLLICYYMGTQWGLTKAWTLTSSEQEVRGYFKTISAVGKPFEYGLLTQMGPK